MRGNAHRNPSKSGRILSCPLAVPSWEAAQWTLYSLLVSQKFHGANSNRDIEHNDLFIGFCALVNISGSFLCTRWRSVSSQENLAKKSVQNLNWRQDHLIKSALHCHTARVTLECDASSGLGFPTSWLGWLCLQLQVVAQPWLRGSSLAAGIFAVAALAAGLPVSWKSEDALEGWWGFVWNPCRSERVKAPKLHWRSALRSVVKWKSTDHFLHPLKVLLQASLSSCKRRIKPRLAFVMSVQKSLGLMLLSPACCSATCNFLHTFPSLLVTKFTLKENFSPKAYYDEAFTTYLGNKIKR